MHQVAAAADEGADRRTEPLREAEGDGVEPLREGGRGLPHRQGGVEDPGAVEMERHAVLPAQGHQGLQVRLLIDRAAAEVVAVLDRDQGGLGTEGDVRSDGRLDGRGVEEPEARGIARGGGERLRHQARDRRHGSHLVEEDVAEGVADHLTAREAVQVEGDLIAHRPRGDEEPGLLPHRRRPLFLQGADRRVLAEDVVADLGLGHRPPHLGVGTGHGVGAEVEDAHAHAAPSRYSRSSSARRLGSPSSTCSATACRARSSSGRTPRFPSRASPSTS